MSRRFLALALVAAVALPLVGCQFLLFKICVKNQTEFWLDELAVKSSGEPTYPPAALALVPPGGAGTAGRYGEGAYDIRATFDAEEQNDGKSTADVCDATVELTGVEIESSNLCITYETTFNQQENCDEIYASLDYVL